MKTRIVAAALAGATALALGTAPAQASPARRSDTELGSDARWQVVVGTFHHMKPADALLAKLKSSGLSGFGTETDRKIEVERTFHRADAAQRLERTLRKDGYSPFVERGDAR